MWEDSWMGFAFLTKVKNRVGWRFGLEKGRIVTFATQNNFDEKAIGFRQKPLCLFFNPYRSVGIKNQKRFGQSGSFDDKKQLNKLNPPK